MALNPDKLRDKLREFCDRTYAEFRGFPTTRDAARLEWAAAFAAYLSLVEEDIPRPPPPPKTHPSLVLTDVEKEFFEDLDLTNSVSAADAAADFAGAWEKGIGAITPGGPAIDSATGKHVFVRFSNTATMKTALRARLKALFASPTTSTVQRLTDIAKAFHDATDGLEAVTSYTAPAPPTVPPAPGTYGLR